MIGYCLSRTPVTVIAVALRDSHRDSASTADSTATTRPKIRLTSQHQSDGLARHLAGVRPARATHLGGMHPAQASHLTGMHPVRASTSAGCTRFGQALRRRAAASGKHLGGVQPPQARRRSQGGTRAEPDWSTGSCIRLRTSRGRRSPPMLRHRPTPQIGFDPPASRQRSTTSMPQPPESTHDP
jgi:hypothetical protein